MNPTSFTQELKSNRDAVITIQGGGVFGLTLLGQLQAVVEQHRYTPLALAGTSAGAIVATLLWAGLTPTEIRDEFYNMVKEDPTALLNLLGPFQPHQFDFTSFSDLKQNIDDGLDRLNRVLVRRAYNPVRWFATVQIYRHFSRLKQLLLPHFRKRGFFKGELLEHKR